MREAAVVADELAPIAVKVFKRIRPEHVAHDARRRGLPESVNGPNVVEGDHVRAETSVDAEELLIHDGRERKRAECVHAGLVDGLTVLVLACRGMRLRLVSERWASSSSERGRRTLKLEGEVVGKVTALVVTAEEVEGRGVVDLKGPEVEDTLRGGSKEPSASSSCETSS